MTAETISQPLAGPSLGGLARKLFFLVLLLTLFIVPIIIVPRVATMNPAVHSKELAARILTAVLGLTFVACWPWRRRVPWGIEQWSLIALVGCAAMSTLISGRISYCFFESWQTWAFVLVAVAIIRFEPSVGDFSKIIAMILLTAVIVAIYGLAVYSGHDFFHWLYPFVFSTEEGRNYVHSFLGNPEYFGSYMAPMAVLAFSRFFLPEASLLRRVGWVGLTLFFLFSLLLSGTRGAVLGFFLGALILTVKELPRLPKVTRRVVLAAYAAGIIVGAAVLVIFSFPNPLNFRNMRLAQRFGDLFNVETASVKERIIFNSVSANIIAQNPVFGGGPGSYRLNFYLGVERLAMADDGAGVLMIANELHSRVAEHAHNDYLEIWCELGTVGFGTLLLVLVVAVVRFFRRVPLSPMDASGSNLPLLRSGFFAATAALCFNALFSFPFHMAERYTLIWVLLGSFFAVDRLMRAGAGDEEPEPLKDLQSGQ